jgi:nucleoside-diphosphate-sugar epimerase
MPRTSAGPDQSGRRLGAAGRDRKVVLLTGASGVVGRAVLARLRAKNSADRPEVLALVHRTPVTGHGVTSVAGDVTQPRLGLSPDEYAELARRVDTVIHCAAVTEFNRTDGSLEATNIEGTRHITEFADAADATMYHVSTAFLHARADGARGRTAVGYADSKRSGEDVVRASECRHVILRPSIVIGDSATGEISSFQGLHRVAGAIIGGAVPMIPFDPTWPLDFIPCDVVADAIVTAVENGVDHGEFWLTSGDSALSLAEAVSVTVGMAPEFGVSTDAPRFVPPDLFDRLIGPVFLDALPAKVKITVMRLLEFFAAYLSMDSAMPSDLDRLVALGAAPLPDQRESLRASLRYWAETTGLVAAEREVA